MLLVHLCRQRVHRPRTWGVHNRLSSYQGMQDCQDLGQWAWGSYLGGPDISFEEKYRGKGIWDSNLGGSDLGQIKVLQKNTLGNGYGTPTLVCQITPHRHTFLGERLFNGGGIWV